MKPVVFCSFAATALMLVSTVDAHGQMLLPSYRPITAKYRADCLFGLKGAGDDELQWAPIENLSQRGQADQPAAETFNIYNGCRGLVYESGNNVTEIKAGVEFDVEYYIQATHPGYMRLSIVKPSTDSVGKITYNKDTEVAYFSDFANTAGTFTVSATIPTNVTGCENAGDCALQFYWHSDIANQSYPTCADITIPGSGSGSTSTTTVTSTPVTDESSSASSTTGTQTTTTTAPVTTTDDSEAAGEASYDIESTDASVDGTTTSTDASSDDTTTDAPTTTTATTTEAPTVTTATPTATTSAPTTESDKCSVRRRRARQ